MGKVRFEAAAKSERLDGFWGSALVLVNRAALLTLGIPRGVPRIHRNRQRIVQATFRSYTPPPPQRSEPRPESPDERMVQR